jgi:hypothetical protein
MKRLGSFPPICTDSKVASGSDATPVGMGPTAVAESQFPEGWDPYPFKWGTFPIADDPNDAIKWWLARVEDSSVPDDDPSVVLTDAEVIQLKEMKPKVGHAWYDLAIPAVAGSNRFWEKGVSEWAGEILVYDHQSNPDKQLLDPKVQEICKINIVETKPVLEDTDAHAATAAALEQHRNIHLFIMLAHQYTGAASAVREAARKDVWVVASDLDQGTATSLLHGGMACRDHL